MGKISREMLIAEVARSLRETHPDKAEALLARIEAGLMEECRRCGDWLDEEPSDICEGCRRIEMEARRVANVASGNTIDAHLAEVTRAYSVPIAFIADTIFPSPRDRYFLEATDRTNVRIICRACGADIAPDPMTEEGLRHAMIAHDCPPGDVRES